jgi:hypothetical protein
MVTEDVDPIAEGGLGSLSPLHEIGVRSRGQRARALDTELAGRIGCTPEQQQRQWGRLRIHL